MTADVLVINQANVRGLEQQVALVDGHELRIERKGRRKTTTYRINTLVLADKGRWRLRLPWRWLFLALLTVACLVPGSLISFATTKLHLWLAYGGGALLVAFSLYQVWRKTCLVKSFHTLKARCPLVEIARGKPGKQEFSTFIQRLEDSIRTYREKHKLPEDKQLAGEIRTLRRLKNEKVISKRVYENAKEKLFKLF